MNRKIVILSAALIIGAGLALTFLTNNTNQYVQIPVPTDVTPPFGHGHERLRIPEGDSANTARPRRNGEPVKVTELKTNYESVDGNTLSFRHLSDTTVQQAVPGDTILMGKGEVVVTSKGAGTHPSFMFETMRTQVMMVELGKDAIAQTIADPSTNTVTVRSLHKMVSVIMLIYDDKGEPDVYGVDLADGQEIVMPPVVQDRESLKLLTPIELKNKVRSYSFVSAVKQSNLLQKMRVSSSKEDRKIYNTAEKTAAALMQNGRKGR